MGLVLCQTGTVRHRAEPGHASPADHSPGMPRAGRAASRPQPLRRSHGPTEPAPKQDQLNQNVHGSRGTPSLRFVWPGLGSGYTVHMWGEGAWQGEDEVNPVLRLGHPALILCPLGFPLEPGQHVTPVIAAPQEDRVDAGNLRLGRPASTGSDIGRLHGRLRVPGA